jgi:hypothetical protein
MKKNVELLFHAINTLSNIINDEGVECVICLRKIIIDDELKGFYVPHSTHFVSPDVIDIRKGKKYFCRHYQSMIFAFNPFSALFTN